MKETWSAMRKIIAPIMFVALATAGMTVAGSTAANAATSTITFDGSTYDSIASAYGCDWWTSANDAQGNTTGNALQCSHPGTAGVRLTATSGMSFTSISAPSVSFKVFSLDAPTTLKVRIVAEGVAAPEATLSVPAGWSDQTVDFSGVSGYNASGSYKRLDIEGSGEGHFWVDNINLQIDAPAPVAETSGSKTITFDGSTYDSLASPYGCDWWTSVNDAQGNTTGKALQCSHPGTAGVRLVASGTKSFTNSGNASVSFKVFSLDAPTTLKVRIVAEGVAAPEATLSVPAGWSDQTVDFSGVSGYNSTGSYKRLDIEASDAASFWVDNINLYLNLSAPVAPETPVAGVFLSFGANDDLGKAASAFEGATGAIVDGQYEFTATGEAWSGVNLVNTISNRRLTSTSKPVLTFDYTNPDSSSESVMVKLEGNGPAALLGLTAVPGINHFSVDFSTVTGWDGASTYKNLAIFPGFGGDVGMANTARTGQVYIIDNVSFNGGTSADVYTAPADAFNAEAILVSSSLNGPAAPIGNDWWHGNAPADNFVKYVNAGSTFTITYRIANASTHAALAGKTVTLTPTSPTNNTGPTAAVTATSNSNGEATFTITNTNTNSTSESYRADSANWSDAIGQEYKYEFAVTGVSGADALTRSDNIWGHVVTTAVPAYSGDVTLKSSTLVGPGASVGNGWWHGNAPADNIVKYIVAGQSFNLVYHVADHTTHAAVVGKTVTLSTTGNATITGSLSAVTDSSGDATFSLTSTNTSSDAELARPTGTENAWIPVDVIGGTEYKLDFSVASLSANGSIARGDMVWTHTVKAFSSSAALNGLYVKSASTSSAVIGWTPVSGASYKLTLTGMNGTKAFTKTVTVTSGSSTTVTGLPVGLLNVKVSAIAYSASTVSAATSTNGGVAALSAKAAAAPKVAPVIASVTAGIRKVTVAYSGIKDADNGGATVTAYQYSTDLGATWTNAPASPFDITGLANGATVKVRMRAVNVVGNKASTDKVATVLGAPKAAPAIASATGGIGTVTVSYSAVSSANSGGSAITAYQYSTNNGSTWATAPASPFVISGLGNGETVSVKMRAVNAVGNGVASAAAKTATTASAPKAAPAITSVTAGTGKVTVKYTAVTTANNGGSAITGYQYSINNGSTWLTAGAAAGFDISAAKGATVSVKMRAVNTVGASVASTAKANTSAVK